MELMHYAFSLILLLETFLLASSDIWNTILFLAFANLQLVTP